MTARRNQHRRSLLVALLAAVLLVSTAAPVADARVPSARHYRVGGPITLDTDLVSRSGASAWAIDAYLAAHTPLPALGSAFIAAEDTYGVNARFLLAAALHESGWGWSRIAQTRHNLFGLNAYDRDPGRYASAFRSFAAGIDRTARFMKASYLTPGGRWWGGAPTLRSMQQYWSSSGRWGEGVKRIASSIRLATLSGRSVRFATPVVRGTLHGGDRATIGLRWTGGAIPSRLAFTATWVPITLDADILGTSADVRTAVQPTPIRARRKASTAHAITLSVAAPRQPGRYRLQVLMLDIGGRPLPKADRVRIPAVETRVWGDRAVGVTLAPGPDGTSATLRITNTGRETIPATPGWASSAPHGTEVEEVRSVVTVLATGDDPGDPEPVVLLASPLARDLAPGASLTLDIPGFNAATGLAADRLSVDLRVLDDPSWLAAYLPVSAERTGADIGPLAHPVPAPLGTIAGPGTQPAAIAAATASPTAAPSPSPSPTPSVSVSPSPSPSLSPSPSAAPVATPKPTPTPTVATPKPASTASPTRVTRTYSEHSRRIVYRGPWGDASSRDYVGGGVTWSTTPGATATLTFTGSSVAWTGPVGPTRGRAVVLVDGRVVARVSLWRSSFSPRAVLYKKTFRTAGRHTITIRVLSSPGRPYVAIDGFAVRS